MIGEKEKHLQNTTHTATTTEAENKVYKNTSSTIKISQNEKSNMKTTGKINVAEGGSSSVKRTIQGM